MAWEGEVEESAATATYGSSSKAASVGAKTKFTTYNISFRLNIVKEIT